MGPADMAAGFVTALAPENLAACLAGVTLGTLVGVLPGLGPVTSIALLLPFTFALEPSGAIIMLAGIYYGAQYGGSVAAILVNLPGEASSTVTCLDGHAMARRGRAGLALATAAIASFVGGTFGTFVLAAAAVPLASFALTFEAADYTALLVCGLAAAVAVARGSVAKAIAMAAGGFALASIGTDRATGEVRNTMGIAALVDGIGFVPLAIGLFGFAEIIERLAGAVGDTARLPSIARVRFEPGEARRAAAATLRGTGVGSILGVLPGGGPVVASFASYAIETRVASRQAAPGTGAIEGVAAPEAANNAAAQTSFVPLLTLGLPSGPVGALLLSTLIVHGIQPGPGVIANEPVLFRGLVASMWVGNAMLLVLNLPLVGWWARLVRVPYRFLYPVTVALSCTGIYAIGHGTFDLVVAGAFGLIGYALKRGGFEPAPLLLAFVLAPAVRDNFRRALVFSGGDWSTFVMHPVSAVLLAIAVTTLAASALSAVRR